MNDAEALQALINLMGKGWRFQIDGGSPLVWEVELVGKGLAHWRSCSDSFAKAVEQAIARTSKQEDDPFVVLGKNAVPLARLVTTCFGKDVDYRIDVEENEEGFGPKRIVLTVKPGAMNPDEFVNRDTEFVRRVQMDLPRDLWMALRVVAEWPPEEPARTDGLRTDMKGCPMCSPKEHPPGLIHDESTWKAAVAGEVRKELEPTRRVDAEKSGVRRVREAMAVERVKCWLEERQRRIEARVGAQLSDGDLLLAEWLTDGPPRSGGANFLRRLLESDLITEENWDEQFPKNPRSAASIAGILWEGIGRLNAGGTSREPIWTGQLVSVVEKTKTGYKARIPAALVGIPLGEIRDLGNLAMVEQAENGDYLVRVSTEPEPGWQAEVARKVGERLQPEQTRALEGITDPVARKTIEKLIEVFPTAKLELPDSSMDPARSAEDKPEDLIRRIKWEPLSDLWMDAVDAMLSLWGIEKIEVDGTVINRTPDGGLHVYRGVPARSADAPPTVAWIIREGLLKMRSRNTGREAVETGSKISLVEMSPYGVLATIPHGVPTEGIPLGVLHADTRILPSGSSAFMVLIPTTEDPARSADAILETRPTPPKRPGPMDEEARLAAAHLEDPERSSGAEVRLRIPPGPPSKTKVIQFDDGHWAEVPIGWTPADARKAGATRWAEEVERALGRFPEASNEKDPALGSPTARAIGLSTGSPTLDRMLQKRRQRTGEASPMIKDPSRRLDPKNSWDRATHERLTAAVDDLVRGALMGAETDEEITGHLPTDALVAMDPQAIQDLIAWVRRARGTPGPGKDPARSAARAGVAAMPPWGPPGEGGEVDGEAPDPSLLDPSRRLDAKSPEFPRQVFQKLSGIDRNLVKMWIQDTARAIHSIQVPVSATRQIPVPMINPSPAPSPVSRSEGSAGENKVGDEDCVAARTLCGAIESLLQAAAYEGDVGSKIAKLREIWSTTRYIIAGGGR